MKQKFIFLILLIATLFGFTTSVLAVSKTRDDAINWVRGLEGQKIGSGQCVALISAYYSFLGVSPVSGNACDYATNSLPYGWTREKGGVPQMGDILVYTGGYGHVAIAETTQYGWHQNWGGQYVQWVNRNYSSGYTYGETYVSYWGCIRPNFNSDTTPPTINDFKVTSMTHDSITVTADLSDNIGVTRVWLNIYGPSGSKGYALSASNGKFTHTINTADYGGTGTYSVHLYAFDAANNETGAALNNFSKETLVPKNIWLKADKTNIIIGETVTFSFGIENATKKGIGIDKDNTRYASLDGAEKNTLSYTFKEPGKYCVITEGSNSIGYACSPGIWITVSPGKYALTFDPNGGKVSFANKSVTLNELYGALPVPTRTGYVFKGWYTDIDGGTNITEDTKVMIWDNLSTMTPLTTAEIIPKSEFIK